MSERVIPKPLNKMIFFIVNNHPELIEHTNPAPFSAPLTFFKHFLLSSVEHPRDVWKVISVDFTVAWKRKLGINERARRALIY